MVIFNKGLEDLPQLPLIEHDHTIQAFTPNRTHQPLDVRAGMNKVWLTAAIRRAVRSWFYNLRAKYQAIRESLDNPSIFLSGT